MSKKRGLVLALVLLPLATGSAVIASLAKGSRSSESTELEAPATPTDLANSTRGSQSGESPRLDGAPTIAPEDAPPAPAQETPHATQEPSSSEESNTTDPDENASEPMFARADFTLSGTAARYLSGRGRASVGGGSGNSADGGGSGGGPSSPTGSAKNPPVDACDGQDEPSTAQSSNCQNGNPDDLVRPDDLIDPPTQTEPGEETDEEETDPIYIPPSETTPPVVRVPEPAALGLLGLGLLGCAVARRKKAS